MNPANITTTTYGKSTVVICDDEYAVGQKAALAVADTMRKLLAAGDEIKMAFAAGESQITFLDALARQKDIDWKRVNCFHLDDFHDTRIPDAYTCGNQVEKQLWSKVKPKKTNRIRVHAPDPEAEAKRFEQLIRGAGPIDILCQGIGTSGHLAFNEPFDTDFNDPAWVKVMTLTEQSKRQLMTDPNFRELGYVPEKGISMTIPALLSSRHVFTMVPLALKRPILTRLFALKTPTTDLPASILSQVAGPIFVDKNSCPMGMQGEATKLRMPTTA